jgi:predicted DsbA family dithiol-disulfide isomerase
MCEPTVHLRLTIAAVEHRGAADEADMGRRLAEPEQAHQGRDGRQLRDAAVVLARRIAEEAGLDRAALDDFLEAAIHRRR